MHLPFRHHTKETKKMDEARLRTLVIDEGAVLSSFRETLSTDSSNRMVRLNEVLGQHREGFPLLSHAGCGMYEVKLVAPDEALVLFHLSGTLTHTSSLKISLGRAASEVEWIQGTINGMFPSARSLLSTGVDETALSAYRRMLHFKLDSPSAMKGARGKGEDHRFVTPFFFWNIF